MPAKWTYDNSKSLHDNMWDALIAAAKYFSQLKLRQYKSVPDMTFQEIDNEIYVRAYPWMENKLKAGWMEKHPDLTMWNLAFDCIWSAWGNLRHVKLNKEAVKRIATVSLDAQVPGLDGVMLKDVIPAERGCRYRGTSMSAYGRDRRENALDDLLDYIDACAEFGVKPDSEMVEEAIIQLPKLPAPEDVPGFETTVKLMKMAKYKIEHTVSGVRTWIDLYDRLKNNPPKEIVYVDHDSSRKSFLHREPNPFYRPGPAQPARPRAAEGPQGTS